MSLSSELLELPESQASPIEKPLDQAAWDVWVSKNRAEERRNNAVFFKGVKCLAIAGLMVVAGFWSHLGPFDLVIRFIVAAGAMVAMFQAFHTRQFVFAGLFGALVALYNPVAAVMTFSGGWQRAVVAASALPFIVSLGLANVKDTTE